MQFIITPSEQSRQNLEKEFIRAARRELLEKGDQCEYEK